MGWKYAEDRQAYHRGYMREYRQWRKAHKCCADCGKQDAYTLNGRYRCFECAEKRRKTPIEYIPEEKQTVPSIPRHERGKYGMCYLCGDPLDGGETAWRGTPRKLCGKCYAKVCATNWKGREAHIKKYGYKYGSIESTRYHGW